MRSACWCALLSAGILLSVREAGAMSQGGLQEVQRRVAGFSDAACRDAFDRLKAHGVFDVDSSAEPSVTAPGLSAQDVRSVIFAVQDHDDLRPHLATLKSHGVLDITRPGHGPIAGAPGAPASTASGLTPDQEAQFDHAIADMDQTQVALESYRQQQASYVPAHSFWHGLNDPAANRIGATYQAASSLLEEGTRLLKALPADNPQVRTALQRLDRVTTELHHPDGGPARR